MIFSEGGRSCHLYVQSPLASTRVLLNTGDKRKYRLSSHKGCGLRIETRQRKPKSPGKVFPPYPATYATPIYRRWLRNREEKREEKNGQNKTGNHLNNFFYSQKWNGSESDRSLTIISRKVVRLAASILPPRTDQTCCRRQPRVPKDRSPRSSFPTKFLQRARKGIFLMFWLFRPFCLEYLCDTMTGGERVWVVLTK